MTYPQKRVDAVQEAADEGQEERWPDESRDQIH